MHDPWTAGRGAVLVAAALLASAPEAHAEPQAFETPDAAVDAVIAALEAVDAAALVAVFGPENEDVALTGDAEVDREVWSGFLSDYRALNRIAEEEDGVATLYVGFDQWPFPARIVEGPDGSWRFDAAAAREEVLLRRIGRNELDVIELLRGYVRAQAEYRRIDYDGDGVLSFASGILSSEGRRDGLYWPAVEGFPESPIGDFMARAAADGYSTGGDADAEPEPYLGYYYRVLTGQGEAAPGGAMDYIVNGRMLAGHALLAFPAAYDDTGIMSFMVGEAGVVYEADLGEATLEVADAIELFDPGEGWTPVEDEGE
jgi:hypothetical protein